MSVQTIYHVLSYDCSDGLVIGIDRVVTLRYSTYIVLDYSSGKCYYWNLSHRASHSWLCTDFTEIIRFIVI